jgi:hypothetical protein
VINIRHVLSRDVTPLVHQLQSSQRPTCATTTRPGSTYHTAAAVLILKYTNTYGGTRVRHAFWTLRLRRTESNTTTFSNLRLRRTLLQLIWRHLGKACILDSEVKPLRRTEPNATTFSNLGLRRPQSLSTNLD